MRRNIYAGQDLSLEIQGQDSLLTMGRESSSFLTFTRYLYNNAKTYTLSPHVVYWKLLINCFFR